MKKFKKSEIVFAVSEYQLAYKSLSKPSIKIERSKDVYDVINPFFQDFHGIKEAFFAVYLNRANKVVGVQKISEGSVAGCVVDPRLVMKGAIDLLASVIIVVHNHPSGNLKPSKADNDITKKLKDGAKFFDMELCDHLIISEDGYYSFADQGDL